MLFKKKKRKHVIEKCSGLLFYYSKYLILAYPESKIIPGKYSLDKSKWYSLYSKIIYFVQTLPLIVNDTVNTTQA